MRLCQKNIVDGSAPDRDDSHVGERKPLYHEGRDRMGITLTGDLAGIWTVNETCRGGNCVSSEKQIKGGYPSRKGKASSSWEGGGS